jgi:hypothetical protein
MSKSCAEMVNVLRPQKRKISCSGGHLSLLPDNAHPPYVDPSSEPTLMMLDLKVNITITVFCGNKSRHLPCG